MILKDRFLTQLAPDIFHKLLKWTYGPNQSLDTLLQLAQTVYYGREYEEKKERQKKTKEKAEAFAMTMKNVLKQPEKNVQRDPGEKGWACYYCGKEGHLKWDCPQASKLRPGSTSGLQRTTLEERLSPEAQVSGVGLSRQSGLKVPWGSPHKLPS